MNFRWETRSTQIERYTADWLQKLCKSLQPSALRGTAVLSPTDATILIFLIEHLAEYEPLFRLLRLLKVQQCTHAQIKSRPSAARR